MKIAMRWNRKYDVASVHFGFALCCAILFDKDELKEFETAHDCEDAVMRFLY